MPAGLLGADTLDGTVFDLQHHESVPVPVNLAGQQNPIGQSVKVHSGWIDSRKPPGSQASDPFIQSLSSDVDFL